MSSDERIEEVSNSAALVFPIYLLAILPLALYVYHDILNARFRRVQNLAAYGLAYTWLFVTSAFAIFGYMLVQFKGNDFKEVGASVVALLLGGYGFWKLLRLFHILRSHKRIVEGPLATCDELLQVLVPNDSSNSKRCFRIDFTDHPFSYWLKPSRDAPEHRCHYISCTLFDDDWPGDSAPRIDWLRKEIRLAEEDADDAATVFALYMRFSLRSARKQIWTLFVQTHPLLAMRTVRPGSSTPARVSLGRMLMRLANGGSGVEPPSDRLENPVQTLLNSVYEGSSVTPTLSGIGVAFFWTAVEQSADEVSQAIGKFPQRWLRGTRSTGFDWIAEMSFLLILSETRDNRLVSSSSRGIWFPRKNTVNAKKQAVYNYSMALTPMLEEGLMIDEETMEGEDLRAATSTEGTSQSSVVPSVSGEPHVSGASWLDEYRKQELRQESAFICAEALSTMLLRNNHVLQESGSAEALRQRVKVALSSAFEHFTKPDCLSSASADSRPRHGQVVAIAIVELLRTATAAGLLVDRIMGSKLRIDLDSQFGKSATMTKSEICWGLGFLVENLEEKIVGSSMDIPSMPWTLTGRLRIMLARWIEEFGLERELAEDDTMFDLLLESERRRVGMSTCPIRSAALWLLQSDGDAVSVCPDPLKACIEHVKFASKFAEGVLLAFEAWNERHSSQTLPAYRHGSQGAGQVLRIPAKFGSLADLQNNWMTWKVHAQAQCEYVDSAYVNHC